MQNVFYSLPSQQNDYSTHPQYKKIFMAYGKFINCLENLTTLSFKILHIYLGILIYKFRINLHGKRTWTERALKDGLHLSPAEFESLRY